MRKQVAPQGSIDLTEMISSGEPCVDVHHEPHVMQDREYCVRLHTSKRIYYIQFDSEIDRKRFSMPPKQHFKLTDLHIKTDLKVFIFLFYVHWFKIHADSCCPI